MADGPKASLGRSPGRRCPGRISEDSTPTNAVADPHAARSAYGSALIAGALALSAGIGSAITPGRAWAPVERLNEPGFAYLIGPRIDVGLDGIPTMAVSGVVDQYGQDGLGYRWGGAGWVHTWNLGQTPQWFWPVISPPGTNYLVWNDQCCFDFASITMQGIAERETIATTFGFNAAYSAAVTTRRRWAAVHDYDYFDGGVLRVFSSAAPRSWHETRLGDIGLAGVALAPLQDTTAVLAVMQPGPTGGGVGLWRVDDSGVTYTGLHTPGAHGPRFRPRPSGGLWLAWDTAAPYIALTTYREGLLVEPDTLRCNYLAPPEWQYVSQLPDMSRDGGEYPAVAWGAYSQLSGGVVLCASVPTDQGFSVADQIPNAGGNSPTVARDVNGDVWVGSWNHWYADYAHTYTVATASAPRLAGAGTGRTVAWTLSEPAPETWWAVLRAVNGGAFEPVARVRAGPSLEMSWTDAPPPARLLAYKVRRECLDTRYGWESEAVTVGAGSRPPIYLGPPVNVPGGGGTEEPGAPEDRRWGWLRLSI